MLTFHISFTVYWNNTDLSRRNVTQMETFPESGNEFGLCSEYTKQKAWMLNTFKFSHLTPGVFSVLIMQSFRIGQNICVHPFLKYSIQLYFFFFFLPPYSLILYVSLVIQTMLLTIIGKPNLCLALPNEIIKNKFTPWSDAKDWLDPGLQGMQGRARYYLECSEPPHLQLT